MALNACSLALNAGDPATTPATVGSTDLIGKPRIMSNRVDMGAVKYPGAPGRIAFTAQPASSATVTAGANVRQPVGISGTASSLQWFNQAGRVSGQTSATLTLTRVTASQSGSYRLVATSPCNSVTSTAVNLSVLTPPALTVSKTVSGNFVPGGSLTYTIILTNTCQTTQADNVCDELTDELENSLTLSSARATSGSLQTSGQRVSWNGRPARWAVGG